MFEARYGHSINQARTTLGAAVTSAADQVAALIDEHSVVRPGEPGRLLSLTRKLGAHQSELRAAVNAYPLALAMDTNGRPDKAGEALARLMATLEHVLVFYRNLENVPEHLRGQAHRDLEGLTRDALSVQAMFDQ
jgi:hypothetical protein